MFNEEEVFLICPYCFQKISVLIEVLYGNQEYIEDCEVCCQPLKVLYSVEEGEVKNYAVQRADGNE